MTIKRNMAKQLTKDEREVWHKLASQIIRVWDSQNEAGTCEFEVLSAMDSWGLWTKNVTEPGEKQGDHIRFRPWHRVCLIEWYKEDQEDEDEHSD